MEVTSNVVRKSVMALGVMASLLALAGCAVAPVAKTPEEIVKQRSQSRWDAAVAGDVEKAYSFVIPSFRALTSVKLYGQQIIGSRNLKLARVEKVSCEDERCNVSVRLEFPNIARPQDTEMLTTYYDERWVLQNGEWWLFVQ